MNPLVACPKCRAWLLEGVFNTAQPVPCPSCHTPLQVDIYPALFRAIAPGQSAVPVMVEGESSCFFHPQKQAVVPCAACGRFLCALCDCEFGGRHLCPACLETGKSKGKILELENQRTRYDKIALALAVYPLIIFYFTLITAPLTLFLVIRYWKAPRSLVQSNPVRFLVAGTIALLQIGGWTAFFIVVATHH